MEVRRASPIFGNVYVLDAKRSYAGRISPNPSNLSFISPFSQLEIRVEFPSRPHHDTSRPRQGSSRVSHLLAGNPPSHTIEVLDDYRRPQSTRSCAPVGLEPG